MCFKMLLLIIQWRFVNKNKIIIMYCEMTLRKHFISQIVDFSTLYVYNLVPTLLVSTEKAVYGATPPEWPALSSGSSPVSRASLSSWIFTSASRERERHIKGYRWGHDDTDSWTVRAEAGRRASVNTKTNKEEKIKTTTLGHFLIPHVSKGN